MARWKSRASGSLCRRRRSRTGVRSAPPPNHWRVVTTMRVFMCTAGTCGLTGWAISEMPEAQKAGSSSAPGNLAAELRRELAVDGRGVHADLLEDAPVHHRHDAAAARLGTMPLLALEPARLAIRQRTRQLVLERFESSRRWRREAPRTSGAPSPSSPRSPPAAPSGSSGRSIFLSPVNQPLPQ